MKNVTTLKLFFSFLLALLLFTSCRPAGFIFTEDGKIECGGDGKAIILSNNATATDPTFAQLVAFIKADKTDSRQYILSGPGAFVCADFAEAVHNNAEAAGIRAGWVSLTFEGTNEGHALDAFETTDKGLIYIDCTSGSSKSQGNAGSSWDAIAYVEEGRSYGVLPIDRVLAETYDFYALEYDYYLACQRAWQEYTTKLQAYNNGVDRYNTETAGRTFTYGSAEWRRVTDWKNELIAQEKDLEILRAKSGNRWLETEYSSYLVKNVMIHW